LNSAPQRNATQQQQQHQRARSPNLSGHSPMPLGRRIISSSSSRGLTSGRPGAGAGPGLCQLLVDARELLLWPLQLHIRRLLLLEVHSLKLRKLLS
jgi:hypothetical protein